MYLDKNLMENKFHQVVDHFNEKNIPLQSFIRYSATKYIL